MEFILEKSAMLVIEKGKIPKSVDVELPDGKVIKSLQEGEYLRILEVDRFLQEEIKLKKIKVKKVLILKLNSGNLIHGINTSAVSLL